MISVAIIDDEPLARERIKAFLNTLPEVKVVAEAGDGTEGLEVIAEHRPDFIFLDIQMPEMDGFTMLQHLAEDCRPLTVFTTAYDEYAIKAFDVHAVDYLLKPFSKERFKESVEKVFGQLEGAKSTGVQSTLNALLESMQQPQVNRLTIKEQGRMYFVDVASIERIEAAGNYAEIFTAEKSHLIRETMTQLEKKLSSANFMRLNRSAIISLRSIKEVVSEGNSDYFVKLSSGARVKCTASLRSLQEKLSKL